VRHRALAHARHAVRALASTGDPETVGLALDNLESRDRQQRANALEALEGAGSAEVVGPLVGVWEASPPRAGDGAEAVLLELLRDEDAWIRACSAFAARSLKDPELTAALRDVARSDEDPLVREAASTKGGEAVETLSTLSVMERVLFLRRVRMFGDLGPRDLKQIAEVASEHVYPDGELVAEQGEAGDEMHIVVSGAIRVVMGADGGPGREVARRGTGEYVGEMAIISEEPRMASLVCDGEVRTLSIDRRRFERILKERPDASLAVMRDLCDRLRAAHEEARI
jgi:hypothetical protein